MKIFVVLVILIPIVWGEETQEAKEKFKPKPSENNTLPDLNIVTVAIMETLQWMVQNKDADPEDANVHKEKLERLVQPIIKKFKDIETGRGPRPTEEEIAVYKEQKQQLEGILQPILKTMKDLEKAREEKEGAAISEDEQIEIVAEEEETFEVPSVDKPKASSSKAPGDAPKKKEEASEVPSVDKPKPSSSKAPGDAPKKKKETSEVPSADKPKPSSSKAPGDAPKGESRDEL